ARSSGRRPPVRPRTTAPPRRGRGATAWRRRPAPSPRGSAPPPARARAIGRRRWAGRWCRDTPRPACARRPGPTLAGTPRGRTRRTARRLSGQRVGAHHLPLLRRQFALREPLVELPEHQVVGPLAPRERLPAIARGDERRARAAGRSALRRPRRAHARLVAMAQRRVAQRVERVARGLAGMEQPEPVTALV